MKRKNVHLGKMASIEEVMGKEEVSPLEEEEERNENHTKGEQGEDDLL